MAEDLTRPIARALTPSATGLLARQLTESLGAVRTGLDAAVGSAFRALTAKAETEAGAQEVLSVLRESQGAGAGLLDKGPRGLEERLRASAPIAPHAAATAAVDRVFSGRRPGLIDHLASFAKIKRASAGSLLELGALLALAALNDARAVENGPSGAAAPAPGAVARCRGGAASRIRPGPRGRAGPGRRPALGALASGGPPAVAAGGSWAADLHAGRARRGG